jgi:predicted dehydrogenase
MADSPTLKRLYLDAEHEDGYERDRNVFSPGITIEDDMAVAVGYDTGASLSYHLTAYSPWEGYRVAINGSRGRLELEVAENTWASAGPAPAGRSAVLHGVEETPGSGWSRLLLRSFWGPPQEIELPPGGPGHGGADAQMVAEIFGAGDRPDPLGRRSDARDGALALLTGLAANRSFETGQAIDVADLLDPALLTPA